MILLIDNYDSFSYNLYQLIGMINPNIKVIRNDELSIKEIALLNPKYIILSPGPKRPIDAGVCIDVVKHFKGKVPILGVCLGHQSICEAFNATVSYAKELKHGKQDIINIDNSSSIFKGMDKTILGARYHSLAVLEDTLPDELQIIARTKDNEIMAVAHKKYKIYGLQFHPESILTPKGIDIIKNFLGGNKMIKEALNKVIKNIDLDFNTAKTVMEEIMNGDATNAQISAFITALRMKGESVDEISACAYVMRDKSSRITYKGDAIDIVGTGGDEAGTINISTASAILVASGGVKVAKHGNRSVSSKSGSADVLEALGVKIDIPVSKSQEMLDELGLCFMYAPLYHSSMKYAAPVRKEIGIRTIFNILGPLSNPAKANLQLMGVYDDKLIEPMAKVLSDLGIKRGIVIRGNDGLDEATITDSSRLCEIKNGKITSYEINPEDYGIKKANIKDIVGGDAKFNAKIIIDIFKGEFKGPKRDIIVFNSGIALYLANKANTINDGIILANELIDNKSAYNLLNKFISKSNS